MLPVGKPGAKIENMLAIKKAVRLRTALIDKV